MVRCISGRGTTSMTPKVLLTSGLKVLVKISQSMKRRVDLDQHAPVFSVEVSLNNGMSAIGVASSKRKAEQLAANQLLQAIKKSTKNRSLEMKAN